MKKVTLIAIASLMFLSFSGTGVFADDPDAPAPVETTGTVVKTDGDNPAPTTQGSDDGRGDHPDSPGTKPE